MEHSNRILVIDDELGLRQGCRRALARHGYEVDVASVTRPTRIGGWTPGHLAVILEQGPAEIDEENSPPGNPRRVTWRQTFAATLIVQPPDGSGVAVESIMNTFRADVEKAIMKDPSWGGLALSTMTDLAEPIPPEFTDGSYEALAVQFVVAYRTPENDPYTQG